jgi:hypothetical protein
LCTRVALGNVKGNLHSLVIIPSWASNEVTYNLSTKKVLPGRERSGDSDAVLAYTHTSIHVLVSYGGTRKALTAISVYNVRGPLLRLSIDETR